MKKLIILTTATAVASLASATTYQVVADWDSASSANYQNGRGDLTTTNGWTTVPAAVGVTNRVVEVALDETDDVLAFTPKAPVTTNKFETAYVALTNGIAGGLYDVTDGVQAALAAVDDGTETNWYGWCRCGGNAAGWCKLTNAVPKAGACVVRMEFDNSNAVKLVRYAVKQGNDSGFTVLKANGAEWLTNGVAATISRVEIGGRASFTNIVLTQTGTFEASTAMTNRMDKMGIKDTDLNNIAKNGNSNWENLVLGLDGTNTLSKPVVQPVQSSDPSKVTLKLGNVNVDASGATVKYRVWSGTTPGGREGGSTDPVAYGNSTAVDLPTSGVKYYTMEVITAPADETGN